MDVLDVLRTVIEWLGIAGGVGAGMVLIGRPHLSEYQEVNHHGDR